MDSKLKVTIDPSQANSGISSIEARLGSFATRSVNVFNKFQSTINGSFKKFGSSASDSFIKLQFVTGTTFSRIKDILRKDIAAINSIASAGFHKVAGTIRTALSKVQDNISNTLKSGNSLSLLIKPKVNRGAIGAILTNFQKLSSKILGLFSSIFSQVFSAAIIGEFMHNLLNVTNEYNAFIATIELSTKALAGADNEYKFLFDLSNNLGVSVQALTKSYAKFSAAVSETALAGKGAREIFESIAMVSSVLHLKGYDTERLFYAITQSISKGRVYREELVQQLSEKLPGAMTVAAKSMNYFTKEGAADTRRLNKELTDGTINVYKFWLNFSQGLKETYGDSAAIAAELLEANINRMRNRIFDFFVEIKKGASGEALINLVKAFTHLVKGATTAASGFSDLLAEIFNKIADGINSISIRQINELVLAAGALVKGLMSASEIFVKGIIGVKVSDSPILDFVHALTKSFQTLSMVLTQIVNLIRWIAMKNAPINFGLEDAWEKLDKLDPNAPLKDTLKTYAGIVIGAQMSMFGAYEDIMPGLEGPRDKRANEAFAQFSHTFEEYTRALENTDKMFADLKRKIKAVPNTPVGALIDPKTEIPTGLDQSVLDEMLKQLNPFDPKKADSRHKMSPQEQEYFRTYKKELDDLVALNTKYDNIIAGRPEIYQEHTMQMEQLLRTNSKLANATGPQKIALRDLAAAVDFAKVQYDNLNKTMNIMREEYQNDLTYAREIAELRQGAAGRFTHEAQARQETLFGGANYELTDDQKQLKILNGRKRDLQDLARYTTELNNTMGDTIRGYVDEANVIGMTEIEAKKYNEVQKINNQLRLDSIGASDEVIKKLKEQAAVMKSELINAMDVLEAKSKSAWAGAQEAINKYLADVNDASKFTEMAFTTVFQGLEDLLFDFYRNGEFKFSEFISSIQDIMMRQFIKEGIVAPMVEGLKGILDQIGNSNSGGTASEGFYGLLGNIFNGANNSQMELGSTPANAMYVRDINSINDVASQVGKTIDEAAKDTGFIGKFFDKIKDGFGSLASIGSQVFSQIASFIGQIFSSVGSFGSGGGGGSMFGSVLSLFSLFSSNGNVFPKGGFHEFANGGILSGPTVMNYARSGLAIGGERADEAVMPLARDSKGRLAVRVADSQSNSTTQTNQVNVTNQFMMSGRPDRRTQDQVAAKVGEAINRAIYRNR